MIINKNSKLLMKIQIMYNNKMNNKMMNNKYNKLVKIKT